MRALSICVFVLAVSTVLLGQSASNQRIPENKDCGASGAESKTTPTPPCSPPRAAAPPAAERFPYPGEASSTSRDPEAPTPPQSPPVPAPSKQFPYPGEGSSSSSSSSSNESSSSSSSNGSGSGSPGVEDRSNQGSIRRKLPKPERLQSDEDRAAEDLIVAKFYRESGNLQAAYLRAKDAVKVQPGDPVAHFALADIAQHLHRRDEAVAEYDAYLRLEPDGDQVKAAQKALATLK